MFYRLEGRVLPRRRGDEVDERVEHASYIPAQRRKEAGLSSRERCFGTQTEGHEPRCSGWAGQEATCCQGVDVAALPTLADSTRGGAMANPVPAGSDVSSGTYRCTNCDNEIQMESKGHIPPCPSCGNGEWDTVRGGDSD